NNAYRDKLEAGGLVLSGLSPDGSLVEMIEIKDHPWFVASQFHPELKSRPMECHPLFKGFIKAALQQRARRSGDDRWCRAAGVDRRPVRHRVARRGAPPRRARA